MRHRNKDHHRILTAGYGAMQGLSCRTHLLIWHRHVLNNTIGGKSQIRAQYVVTVYHRTYSQVVYVIHLATVKNDLPISPYPIIPIVLFIILDNFNASNEKK